ncbi:MAG: CIA30 family protein [Cyanobacteria bacterium J06598_3]
MSTDGRAQWSASRFLETLGYFGEVPFLGSFRWVQQLMGKSPVVPGMTLSKRLRTVLIIGSIHSPKGETAEHIGGNSAPEVVRALQNRLGDDVTLIFHPEKTAETGPSLNQLVLSADTAVVLSAEGLLSLMTARSAGRSVSDESGSAGGATSTSVEQCVFDFEDPACDLSAWGSLDDVVMGGVSQGGVLLRKASEDTDLSAVGRPTQVAVFAGRVSTDNSGGFSSVRTRNFEPPFDFAGWRGLRLRVKGDGQRYKFIARNSGGWDSPAYIYSFDTTANTWMEVEIPFDELIATFRARSVPDAPAFDPQRVFSFQLMLSKFEYDRQLNPKFSAGPFELAVSKMSVYRPRQGVPLVVVGDRDDAIRGQQQAALHEAQINYRFIEPGSGDVVDAIAQALS